MKKGYFSVIFFLLFFCTFFCAAPRADAASIDSWFYHAGDFSLSKGGADSWQSDDVREDADWHPFQPEEEPEDFGNAKDLWLTAFVREDNISADTLLFHTEGQTVQVWLGDQQIYSYMSMGQQWHLVRLPEFHGLTRLTIHLSSTWAQQPHKIVSLSIGSEIEQAEKYYLFDLPYVMTVPAALVTIVILLVFNQKAWRRIYRQLIALHSILTIWMLCEMNLTELFIGHGFVLWTLSTILLYLIPICALAVIETILEPELSRDIRYLRWAFLGIFAVAVGMEFLGQHGLQRGKVLLDILLSIGGLWSIIWMGASVKRGNIYSKALIVPMTTLFLFYLFDGWYYLLRFSDYPLILTPFSVYAFVFFLFILLRQQIFWSHKLESEAVGLEFEAAQAVERAEVDPLTNCLNRAAFERMLQEYLQRRDRQICLIMFDIDHFKSVNDTFGHDTGDKVLVKLTRVVRRVLDRRTKFFRWGGEEFVVLCPEISLSEAAELALRICHTVAASMILPQRQITVSLGVARWHGPMDKADELFQRMDQALYRAKEGGRNRVAVEMPQGIDR